MKTLRLLAFLCVVPGSAVMTFAAGPARPNIVFILADDIGETNNLADSQPEKVKELRAKLDELLKHAVPSGAAKVGDAAPKPRPRKQP
jgi:hypothetical protein